MLGQLRADRAAAEHDQARRGLLGRRSLAVAPRPRGPGPLDRSGIAAPLPVAIITDRFAVSTLSPTVTLRSPSRRPSPRTALSLGPSEPGSCTESSRSWTTSSRRSRTAWGSSSPVTASAAPGTRRASSSSSPGRRRAFGRHARVVGALAADQVLLDDRHLLSPPSARRPAQTSPVGPAPSTIASNSLSLTRPSFPDTVQSKAHSTGATGFDVVDPCERLQVEVAGGLVKPRHQPIRADHEFALAA